MSGATHTAMYQSEAARAGGDPPKESNLGAKQVHPYCNILFHLCPLGPTFLSPPPLIPFKLTFSSLYLYSQVVLSPPLVSLFDSQQTMSSIPTASTESYTQVTHRLTSLSQTSLLSSRPRYQLHAWQVLLDASKAPKTQ